MSAARRTPAADPRADELQRELSAALLDKTLLLGEAKEALARQTAVSEVLAAIGRSGSEAQPVFDLALAHAGRLSGADRASLWLCEGDVFRHAAGWSEDGTSHDAYIAFARQRPSPVTGTGVTGRVYRIGAAVQILDVTVDPDYPKEQLQFMAGWMRTLLGVPLLKDGMVIGVFSLARGTVKPFSDHDIALMRTFADQAVLAIENARLLSEMQESLEQQIAMSDVLKAIGQAKSDVQPVFEAINEHAARLCHATLSAISRVEGEHLPLVAASRDAPQALVDVLRRKPPRIDRSSAVGRAVLERRTIHLLDALADPEYARVDMSEAGGYRTVLAVPLLRDGVPIGVLGLTRLEVRPFTDREIQLVETFADQAVIAIENVRLFQAVERQRQELTRFVSPQVASLLTSDEGQRLLEGHRRAITVLFCDLRGFSAFSETAEPEEVLGVLREYHAAMGELIVAHGGTLEHFAGDGMMIFFNDPVLLADHELRAVRLAVAMRDCFEAMAQAWRRKGYDLGFGIGAAVGHATLGRIGFEGRYDYGAIGNAVIIASRLSAEAKTGQILLTQRLHAAVEHNVNAEAVGELSLRGQTRPTAAFNVKSLRPAE